MSDKKCPRCGLWNEEYRERCDCGYIFYFEKAPQNPSQNSSICWFCKSQPSQDTAIVVVKMYRDVERYPIAGGKIGVRWKSLSILVPRCNRCKDAHINATRIEGFFMFIGFLLAAVAVILGPTWLANLVSGTVVIPIVVLYFLFAIVVAPFFFVGKRIGLLILPHETRPESHNKEFPFVIEMEKKGWEIGKKPPNVR